MKKLILVIVALISNLAQADCFVAQEKDKVLIQKGECKTPYSPASSFKIALSLIGFDSGIFKTIDNPVWVLPEGVDPYINVCKADQSPRTWMKNSCLWYSQILTTKLGMKKFQEYVTNFNYGNMDLSGGLTAAWVSSSLKISPLEQINFLQKITSQKLLITKKAYEKTKEIMLIQELSGGWKLYGKTGNGMLSNDLQHGWFVGYVEKNNRTIEFASHIVDQEKHDTFASFRARNEALNKLWYLINNLEK